MRYLRKFLMVCAAAPLVAALPMYANLVITPTFDSSITSDANAASIESTINSAISFYESTFTDPIGVNITFQEGGGLGTSSFNVYTISYQTFYNALVADGKSPDDADAIARLSADGATAGSPHVLNPVTGTDTVLIKSANAKALGILGDLGVGVNPVDGTIILNTSITNPGSPGTSSTYSLLAVTEHEIDEVLGLGSTLGLDFTAPFTAFNNDPSPEDFFRFNGSGARSFTPTPGASAFFSIDGTTNLVQFNNSPGGDYGDWADGSGVVRVQDAFATPHTNPALGVELRALDVIGYDLASPVVAPEPTTWMLMLGGLGAAYFKKRRA